jgi:hypothetical protein
VQAASVTAAEIATAEIRSAERREVIGGLLPGELRELSFSQLRKPAETKMLIIPVLIR